MLAAMSQNSKANHKSIELRTFKAGGTILLPGGAKVRCSLNEISDISASLVLDELLQLPPAFILALDGRLTVHRHCRLDSQNGTTVNVSFPARAPQGSRRIGFV